MSPKLVLIESDLLPKVQQHTTTPSANGQLNGNKRPREPAVGIVDLAQPAQKRSKPVRSSGSPEDAAAKPVTLTISLSSGPEDSSDSSDSDDSSDSPDSSDDDAEDANGPEDSVVVEGDDSSSGLSEDSDSSGSLSHEEGETSEDDGDDENDDVGDSIQVGDDEAETVLTSAAPETYSNAPSGRPYNKFEGNFSRYLLRFLPNPTNVSLKSKTEIGPPPRVLSSPTATSSGRTGLHHGFVLSGRVDGSFPNWSAWEVTFR